ncbi:3-methyl-2-oxobutanoate hydroxymethyltransferase [Desulfohalovibrio reitneri]|uniref:3-methyl-2-oxobutanoate hydroxymethyltransferase n=1 Tax=Desulfohalovibrio reitneri TaxID=1307759 RepID=UPI0004A6CACA|nr:3-methyl-2-oxobutanoate hydroxymethyltransferase [Desulfohalovibrio reitneri]
MARQLTAPELAARKGGDKIAMLTAYDAATATLAERAGADVLLVGDSLGMVVLGYEDTLSVTMEDMLHHTKAVARTAKSALVVGDMPFGSYAVSVEQAVENGLRFLAEGGARAVKLEGAKHLEAVRALARAGVPVMGHVGLTPQRLAEIGGFKAQARSAEAARVLLQEARDLERAGCFSLVLEAVPSEVAELVTSRLDIPTIGIGAGPGCDGQVLVIHDVLGLFDRFTPRFVKRYAELGSASAEALAAYVKDVRQGGFPGPEHEFRLSGEEREKLEEL